MHIRISGDTVKCVSDLKTGMSMATRSQGLGEVPAPQSLPGYPPLHPVHHSQAEILREEASVPKQPCPQLDTNDAEDEEDEEAEQQDVAQHGQGVQQQCDEDAHACGAEAMLGLLGWPS